MCPPGPIRFVRVSRSGPMRIDPVPHKQDCLLLIRQTGKVCRVVVFQESLTEQSLNLEDHRTNKEEVIMSQLNKISLKTLSIIF